MKPLNVSVASYNVSVINEFVDYKKSTKGLTPRGEEWLWDMTTRFLKGDGAIAIMCTPYDGQGYNGSTCWR